MTLVHAAAWCIFFSQAKEGPAPSGDAAGSIELLKSDSAETRERASEALLRLGKPALGPLRACLSSPDKELVSRAKDIIEQIGPLDQLPESIRRVLPDLEQRIGRDPDCWNEVFFELIRRDGDEAGLPRTLGRDLDLVAAPALRAAIRKKDHRAIEAVLGAAGRYSTPSVIPILVTLLSPSQDLGLLRSAASAAGFLEARAAAPHLIALWDIPDYHLAESVEFALKQAAGPSEVPLLVGRLKSQADWVRGFAASILGILQATDALPELRSLLHNQNLRSRREAAFALGRIGDRSSIPELEKVALEDPQFSVREAATLSLGLLGAPSSLPVILKMADSENKWARECAVIALGNLRSEDGERKLLEMFAVEQEEPVMRVLYPALGRCGSGPAVDALAAALKSHADQRDLIMRAFAPVAREEDRPVLRQFVADANVRISAAEGLCATGSEQGVRLLLKQRRYFALNALRNPGAWGVLSRARWTPGREVEIPDIVERLAKDVGFTVRWPEGIERHFLVTSRDTASDPGRVRGASVLYELRRLTPNSELVLEKDAIRILPSAEAYRIRRDDAVRFWEDWDHRGREVLR